MNLVPVLPGAGDMNLVPCNTECSSANELEGDLSQVVTTRAFCKSTLSQLGRTNLQLPGGLA